LKRKPRVKRLRHEKIGPYDSIWEFILHDTLLKQWSHHPTKVKYIVAHTYEPDFQRTLDGKIILLESKGRFWDHAEYSKYIWVRKNLPDDTELVFLFANPAAPMPNSKIRKDGTKRTHAEWADTNKFRWYSETTLPDEWIDTTAKEVDELSKRLEAVDKEDIPDVI